MEQYQDRKYQRMEQYQDRKYQRMEQYQDRKYQRMEQYQDRKYQRMEQYQDSKCHCRTGIYAYRDCRLSSKLKLLISVLSVSVVGGSVVLHKTNTNKSNSTQ